MTDLTSHWRPAPQIRPKAIGILWRGDAILVCAVPNDDGTTKGWRPLGGTIEFGETAAQTLKRELFEEIGATVSIGAQLGVIENIYTHQGESKSHRPGVGHGRDMRRNRRQRQPPLRRVGPDR